MIEKKTMENEIIKIGIAEWRIAYAPNQLMTLGLGSCVGIILYDPKLKLAGLAHIMLPNSKEIKNNQNRAKFADTGIQDMLEEMIKQGAKKERMWSKIAGGAQMFKFTQGTQAVLNIGQRNVQAVKAVLEQYDIKIIGSDTGENYGRTILFDPTTEILSIRTIGNGMKEI